MVQAQLLQVLQKPSKGSNWKTAVLLNEDTLQRMKLRIWLLNAQSSGYAKWPYSFILYRPSPGQSPSNTAPTASHCAAHVRCHAGPVPENSVVAVLQRFDAAMSMLATYTAARSRPVRRSNL